MKNKFAFFGRMSAVFLLLLTIVSLAPAQAKTDPWSLLKYRMIGPFRGGRVTAVAGVPSQPNVYYFGATGGGVWKTTDGGNNWMPVSDAFFKTGSVGAIAVADSDPNIIYVGMGESPVRGNVSHGDGVYKSTDGGKTWKHIGLGDTRQIGRIRIDPKNPDIAYVAAMGHLWAPNAERGIFRTKDGGKNWEKIVFKNNETGAFDLSFDPKTPGTMFATFWQVKRTPYSLDSGGPGSSIYRSTDGGDTWTDISKNRGLPAGPLGKMGISVSPVNSNRIWAMIEAKDGGLYRSDDGGETWQRTSDNPSIRQRPWYYSRVYADTKSADTVYVLNVGFHKSIDGGRTFTSIRTPHSDSHDLWIAPDDNTRMIEGNDGGANVTTDGGANWSEQDQPTAQFYRVTTDNDFPYNIYGAQQDNSTVRIASRSNEGAIGESDWYDVGGGESGWIAPHPDNSDVVFAGSYGGLLTRYDHRSKQLRDINVWPDNPMGAGADVLKYRFQWNFPLLFSPHRENGKPVLYAAAQVLFKSLDEGQSWTPISGDLTRNEKSRQRSSGGPISQDNTSVEYYCTIFAVAESPITQGVIWAGSDDGLVHITRDGGKSWENVTPKGIPEWIQINAIDASSFDAGTAYVAATAYKSDDYRPYLYKTNDYGKSWTKIVNGIDADAHTRVVREDPNKRGFLYAGTETGMYYSADDGANWQSLRLNLPVVPITDLTIQKREKDLIVATQGRSFYVLDDLPLLHAMADAKKADAFLFKPEDAYRMPGFGGFQLPPTATVGANPPSGAVFFYYLKDKPKQEASLEVLDGSGNVIRKFTGRPPREGAPEGGQADGSGGGGRRGGAGEIPLPIEAGLNRYVWNFRLPTATGLPGLIMWGGSLAGPKIVPGEYKIRLTVDGKAVSTESFAVKGDPRNPTTQAEYQKQFEFLLKGNKKLTETHQAILEIRDIRTQFENISTRLGQDQSELRSNAAAIMKKLTAIEEELIQTKIRSSQDALNFPIRLNNKLAALMSSADSADYQPTAQALAVYDDIVGKIDAQLAALAKIKSEDIAAFNKAYSDKALPVIVTRK